MVKKITIKGLAMMVQKGFNGVDEKFDKVATKEQLIATKEQLSRVEKDVKEIKFLVTDDHRRRIEKLETRVEYLENVLALPNKK